MRYELEKTEGILKFREAGGRGLAKRGRGQGEPPPQTVAHAVTVGKFSN